MEQVCITGIGSDLRGVGRLSDGRAVFVSDAIPGERVEIQIEQEKGRFCEASLCAVLEPSPDRVVSSCAHTGVCGGCQARHIRYARTLELKRQVVFDALSRIGGIDAPQVFDTLGCENPDRTRNKAEYPIGMVGRRRVIGAYARSSNRIVPLSNCLLQQEQSVRALRWFSQNLDAIPCAMQLKFLVTRVNRAGEMMVILCGDAPIIHEIERLSPALSSALPEMISLWYCQLDRRHTHALDGRCSRIWGMDVLPEHLLGMNFEISPQSFFQVNPVQAEHLYLKALEAAGIHPGCDLNVLDAYCGTGTIALAAARWARFAVGIEIVHPAIENARKSAARNGLADRAEFICGDATREIPRLLDRGRRFDAVILDPPRKGADEALLDALIAAGIPAISYVSCNPATLARDVRRLSTGGYQFQWAQPVDMFPWTGHVETVCCLYHQKKDFISVPYEPKDAEYLKKTK